MDKSNDFITMCSKAEEIQALRSVGHLFEKGDFYCTNGLYRVIEVATKETKRFEIDIWLPRLDQLTSLVKYHFENNSRSLFSYLGSSFHLVGPGIHHYDTPEKHVLAFVMKESFDKSWDDKKKGWVKEVILSENE